VVNQRVTELLQTGWAAPCQLQCVCALPVPGGRAVWEGMEIKCPPLRMYKISVNYIPPTQAKYAD